MDRIAYVYRMSSGIEGIRETLALMRSIVRQAKHSPVIIEQARLLTWLSPEKDWAAEVEAIFHFVRDSIRYVLDPVDHETILAPERLLEIGAGDCDDKAVLLASLLEAIGHPTRFVAVGFEPTELSHVYVETRIGDAWIPLDATEKEPAGWRPPGIKNIYIAHN